MLYKMLRNLIRSVIVIALPIATESPGLADVMSDPSFLPVRGVQLKKEVEGNAMLLHPFPQGQRGKVVPVLW